MKGSISGDASNFNNIETRDVIKLSFFPARQVAGGNSSHSDRNIRPTYTIVCHRQTWMAQFKWGDAPRPGRPKTVIILENIDQIHELIMEDRWADFG